MRRGVVALGLTVGIGVTVYALRSAAPVAEAPLDAGSSSTHGDLEREGYVSTESTAGPGKMHISFYDEIEVKKDLVLRSARIMRLSPGSRVLALKVNRYWAGDGWLAGTRMAAFPNFGGCFLEWPPAGFGPAQDVEGFEARAGDILQFVSFVAHPEEPGDYYEGGLEVRYSLANRRGERTYVYDRGNRNDFKRVADTPPDRLCGTLDAEGPEEPWFMEESEFWERYGERPGWTKKVRGETDGTD